MTKVKDSIKYIIEFAIVVIDFEQILKKLLSSLNLLKAEHLYVFKTTKAILIYINKNVIFSTFYVVISRLKSLNNCRKFLVITNLFLNHLFRKNVID